MEAKRGGMATTQTEIQGRILDAARRAKNAATEPERQQQLRKQEAFQQMERDASPKGKVQKRARPQ